MVLFASALLASACGDGDGAPRDAGGRADASADAGAPDSSAADSGDPAPIDGGGPDEDAGAGSVDCFGTPVIHPTAGTGREFCLPDDATTATDEWEPDTDGEPIATGEPGVFRSDGSPRHNIVSPAGTRWWQNVEMTVYLRWHDGADDEFTLYVRGERHTDGMVARADINGGVAAPAGTETWPGYPFSEPVIHDCLGTAYKASLATDGSVFFRKEISHTSGYTDRAGEVIVFPGGLPREQWVGFKFIVRNNILEHVVLSAYVDRAGDGTWEMVTSHEDGGGWIGDPAGDGCDAPPFSYADDQILSWAGPYATLRADFQDFDFRALSVREVGAISGAREQ